jgi:preprotein translocase subunit SecG
MSQDSSTSSTTTIEVRSTSSRAKFLTKLLVSLFLSITFLAVAITLAVWYSKTRSRKRAEAIEMQRLEEARSPEAERSQIQHDRASALATLEGWNGERIMTERSIVGLRGWN